MSNITPRPEDFQSESRLTTALRNALADSTDDSKSEAAAADYERNTAALRKCTETSVKMTPGLMDELTKDLIEALEELPHRGFINTSPITRQPS
jgi:hypothetical protein